ncbi:Glutathione S-transferase omega-2 [Manis javanica]|nr:Glutathione S-transferase omega-2 [Manis javanica]
MTQDPGERTHTRRAGARGPDPQLQQEVLHRTRLVLRAKGIRHEVININLRNKPEWYYTKHPFGQITGLENSQCHLIYESVITLVQQTIYKPWATTNLLFCVYGFTCSALPSTIIVCA